MKLTVKTLKGNHFEIIVQPTSTVMAVKKNIEDVQGKDNYPCGQQLLVHNGKVLKDDTTLADNKVTEEGFVVVMLSKSKLSSAYGTSSHQPTSSSTSSPLVSTSNLTLTSEGQPLSLGSTILASTATSINVKQDTYVQAASNLVDTDDLDKTIRHIMDIGGGNWDKQTVASALRAAYNNPERAIDYLYLGIPKSVEIIVPVTNFTASMVNEAFAFQEAPATGEQFQETQSSSAGELGFLRNNLQVINLELTIFIDPSYQHMNYRKISIDTIKSMCYYDHTYQNKNGEARGRNAAVHYISHKFLALRSMVQENPHILQPLLQELGKQNPQLLRLIQEHIKEFLDLINEPCDGSQGEIFDQPDQNMPHAINVTPAEQEIVEQLEGMGFDRARVIEAFLACDRNEELAANYLLENAGDSDD